MRNAFLWAAVLAAAAPALAAERAFDFSDLPLDQAPPGFRSLVAGKGGPGDWKVVLDDVPPALEPLTAKAPLVRRAVLVQTARAVASNHGPLLVFEAENYGDFKFAARFKISGGALEQAAGLVFRFQNESNFYAVSASALAKSFRCFKVVDGQWKPPLGPEIEITKGSWHEMSVECEGTRIVCSLDGKEAIKLIDASATPTGKVGFCTWGDSTGFFTDAKITYKSREILARKIVNDALKAYPRLLGLKIYAVTASGQAPVVIASKDDKDLGQPGGKPEQEVIAQGRLYFGKDQQAAYVIAPLRDRNGDPIAAVGVLMSSFPGQTQDNAIVRAQPVIKRMQSGVLSLEDLLQ